MRKSLMVYVSLLLLALACKPDEGSEPASGSESLSYDLSHAGLPLAIYGMNTGDSVRAQWNAAFGRMEVDLGGDLSYFIRQDTASCQLRKRELMSGIFTIDYLKDTDSLIAYSTSLPDGSAVYFHFYASFALGGKQYTFESNPLVEYTAQQVETMIAYSTHTRLTKQPR